MQQRTAARECGTMVREVTERSVGGEHAVDWGKERVIWRKMGKYSTVNVNCEAWKGDTPVSVKTQSVQKD